MRTYCTRLTVLLIIYTLVGCDHSKKKVDVKNHSVIAKVKIPCDNPKTVKELLACAKTVGKVNLIRVGTGKDFNSGCDTSWNPEDTVLTITYKDSLVLWRVNQKKNTSTKKYGSWFTNFSAKAAGLTKQETLDLFALNPCPQDNSSWSTCVCKNGEELIDSVIKYEEKVKIGPNQSLLFGVVGQSPFGKGGEMQWHYSEKDHPPYRLLEQITWD